MNDIEFVMYDKHLLRQIIAYCFHVNMYDNNMYKTATMISVMLI